MCLVSPLHYEKTRSLGVELCKTNNNFPKFPRIFHFPNSRPCAYILTLAVILLGDKIDELFDALIPNETPTNLGRGSSRTSKESTVEDGEWVLVERPSRNVSPQSAAGIRGK